MDTQDYQETSEEITYELPISEDQDDWQRDVYEALGISQQYEN